ncbi:hypothetical protein TrLO_g14722, partial [Triparma laevis f. longispina]
GGARRGWDPERIKWTEANDELLFERVKRFGGRVLRRERGWTIIAQPFPGLSVAAVTTRAHKIMRTRNTSIETLVMQGFGNE